jgi:hypothetical protein
MSPRRRVKHTISLEDRIAARAAEIKAKAEALPHGSKHRKRLEHRQTGMFAQMLSCVPSPGRRPTESEDAASVAGLFRWLAAKVGPSKEMAPRRGAAETALGRARGGKRALR